jgi:RES domain-containing protein
MEYLANAMPMLTVFRICKTKYAQSAFDGEGAWRFGGRWNSRGTRIIYTAGSLSLAALEMLVHLQDEQILLAYSFITAQFDEELVLPVEEFRQLPDDWSASPAPVQVQQIGDDWAQSGASAVLEVPTSIIPLERNYLLNPAHPDFKRIRIGTPEEFVFDERLIKK